MKDLCPSDTSAVSFIMAALNDGHFVFIAGQGGVFQKEKISYRVRADHFRVTLF